MYTRTAESLVVNLLRRCYGRNFCQASCLQNHVPRIPSSRLSTSRRNAPSRTNDHWRAFRSYSRSIGSRKFSSTALSAQNQQGKVGSSNIAVVGGGITGLSAAYYLSREFPNANITLIEGSARLGGWLQSTPVKVENGTVLFEGGPRTLRASVPSALATLEIVHIPKS